MNGPKFSLQHSDRIHNPPGSVGKSLLSYQTAAPSIKSVQRFQFSQRGLGNNAIDPIATIKRGFGHFAQQPGIDTRQVASNNCIPFRSIGREQGGFDAGKRTPILNGVRDHRQSELPVKVRVAHKADEVGSLLHFVGDMLRQCAAAIGKQRFVAAHAGTLAPHQNEACKADAFQHFEMVPLQYVIRRLRPALLTALALSSVAHAETVVTRTTITVKADARTGRLVRSVVVSPKVLSTVEPASLETIAPSTAQPISASSLTEMIDTIAQRNQVEASLVHSVIKAESNYNPAALSPKGAQGLMQLIPSTARRFGVSNSFNVQENVEGGVKYLKFLIDLYHNDYKKVIAAYNAGEGAVAKYGGIPPYAETMTYVYRVAKNLKTAREFAELRAAERKIAPPPPVPVISGKTEEEAHPIIAVTGDDGKVYYKTQ